MSSIRSSESFASGTLLIVFYLHASYLVLVYINTLFFYSQWVPEIRHHSPKVPFLLVGTQIDLRDEGATITRLHNDKAKMVSSDQGKKLAERLKAVKYQECSALTQVSFCFSSLSMH